MESTGGLASRPDEGDGMGIIRKRHVVAALAVGATAAVVSFGIAGAHDTKPKHHGSKKHGNQKHGNQKPDSSAMAGMDMSASTKNDKGLSLLVNGHHHRMVDEQALTPTERATLSHQIEATIATAKRFPTVADALAAGYQRTGPYMPGIGAHYIHLTGQGLNPDGVMDDSDLADPLAIVYAGTDPTSPIAGFMYYSMSPKEPAGFAGGNDVWHYHADLCLKYGADGIDAPYGLDHSATKKQCEAVGGRLMQQTQWMVHVWSVPGWESRQGLFGEVNPALMCPDGTYYQYAPEQWSKHPLNACKSVA